MASVVQDLLSLASGATSATRTMTTADVTAPGSAVPSISAAEALPCAHGWHV